MAIPDLPQTTLTFMGPRKNYEVSPNSPAFVTASCDYMRRRSKLCRDLRAGTQAMLDPQNVLRYLPRYEGEATEDYNERLQFASLRNFYAQAVQSILGKMFAQPPKLNKDVPEIIQEDLKDADLNGNDWTIVAERFVDAALDEGLSWLLVDYHNVDANKVGELTMADEIAMGVRPYWAVVPQSSVLGVRYSHWQGIYTITQFRYHTCIKKEDGDFGEQYVEQIRVVEPHRIRVFERDSGSEMGWVEAEGSNMPNTLGMVAATPLNLEETGQFEACPPLENLAYMNLEHFQIRSDQRRALAVASFPILAQYGVNPRAGTAKIGPMTSIAFEDEKSKMEWVESQGIHLLAGDRELLRLESHMRTFGLAFENPQMYATATGRNIDASDAIAPIQRWAYRLRDAINSALWFHARWRKLQDGGTVDVNTSFLKNSLTVEGLKLLVEALKIGKLSPEAFLDRMKDYGILGNEFDVEGDIDKQLEEAVRKAKEAMALKASGPPKDDNSGTPAAEAAPPSEPNDS